MANTTTVCSAGGRVRPVPSLLFSIILLTVFAGLQASSTDVHAATGHVRHKRTVSDLVEGLMNAMYFHMDPMPVSSTVIARITKMPPPTRVYKYVPVQTLKVSKLRARQLGEPKVKIKYPKKFSIKTTGASSLTLVKNDVPWTLHPLPPPLPTSHSVRLEVDKSMPWALHPLPPPMKTKNYSDYYWPDGKGRPKNRPKPPSRPYPAAAVKPSHYVKNVNNFHKYFGANKPPSVTNDGHPDPYHPGHSDFKPSDEYITEHVDHEQHIKPDHHHDDDELNHVDYKHVDYKQVDYNHVDYNKSPDEYKSTDDYKTEYSRLAGEDHDGGGGGGSDDDGFLHSSYSHDDHGHDTSGYSAHGTPPPPPPSSEYVSHITIEPSIQIASFSETEMQGDGTANRDALRSEKQKCQCTTNGHRHKRDATNDTVAGAATLQTAKDPNAEQSAARNAYVGRPNVGHATDVQIIRSHDITDQSINSDGSVGYVQHVRNMNDESVDSLLRPVDGSRAETKKAEPTFRDDSDKFKNEFGRQINSWDESKANRGLFTFKSNGDGDGADGGGAGHYDNEDFGYRTTRKPNHDRGYHVTKSTVENSDRGVAFSVQTPFSVSSFSSNVRHPGERHQSSFRYANADDSRTTTSPLLSSFSSGYPDEPLEFEQFGLQSALTDDGSSGRSHFSRGPGRLTSHFPRDFDNDRSRSKPFRHHVGSSDRFNGGRFKGGRPSSEESVLEYFQPVVIDFEKSKGDSNSNFFAGNSGGGGGGGEKSRYFGKSDSASSGGFSKLKKNQNLDSLRLPGRLHESNENLSRKMHFHPSTFDID